MLPVIDLAGLLRLPTQGVPVAAGLLVAGTQAEEFAFAVAGIGSLGEASRSGVRERSAQLSELQSPLVEGTASSGHWLIDGERLLAASRALLRGDAPFQENN
jgi:hypothetical protein